MGYGKEEEGEGRERGKMGEGKKEEERMEPGEGRPQHQSISFVLTLSEIKEAKRCMQFNIMGSGHLYNSLNVLYGQLKTISCSICILHFRSGAQLSNFERGAQVYL